jgi:hypothetical protein
MAFTKTELEALKNALLASGQPINAATHRAFVQNIIDEMYDAQSRANLLAGVEEDVATEEGDLVLVLRSGAAYLVPASVFGGGAGTLAGLGDVVISDPQEDDLLTYDPITSKWVNVSLAGLYVTQDELNAALDALQLPEGARLISAELILTSDTAGTISAQWVDFESETESVTDEALSFNGGGLPAAGNFRFDIVQGANDGTVSVKQGTEADAASVVVPSPDANNITLSVILWAEDGTAEVNQPSNGNTQQNDWDLIRRATATAPNTTGKFAKVWEGSLSRDGNYSIVLAYAEPKNGTSFDGSGIQILKASWTCNNSRVIIADTVQLTTSAGSTAGEFVLYRLSGNKAALYHKSNHYWGRIQHRVIFQNSQVRLADFTSNAAYGAAPTALITYESTVEAGGGGASAFTDLTDVPTSYTGEAGKLVRVKATEDGLEFVESAAATPPIAESYAGPVAMIADQANQLSGYLYFDGELYYEYLGTTLGTIADYRRVSPEEVAPVAESYADTAAMVADQANQLSGYLYKAGVAYYEYLGTTTGDLTDYQALSAGGGSSLWTEGSGFIYRDSPVAVGRDTLPANCTFVVRSKSSVASHVFFLIEDGSGNAAIAIRNDRNMVFSNSAADLDYGIAADGNNYGLTISSKSGSSSTRYAFLVKNIGNDFFKITTDGRLHGLNDKPWFGNPTVNQATHGPTFKSSANANDSFTGFVLLTNNGGGTPYVRFAVGGRYEFIDRRMWVGNPSSPTAFGSHFKGSANASSSEVIFQIDNSVNGVAFQVKGNYQISTPNLPTADPLIAGTWWNDGGTVKISAG